MANLRRIRERITSVQNTQQITRAMKMVAAAKLRKAQNRIIATRPYAQKLETILGNLLAGTDYHSPYLMPVDEPGKVLFIVIGSDRGLCGGFNNNLFRNLEQEFNQKYAIHKREGRLQLITIGKKATDYFGKRGYTLLDTHPGFFDHLRFDHTHDIMRFVIKQFDRQAFDAVYMVYNEFKSIIAQNRKIEQVLPIDVRAQLEESGGEGFNSDYLFEPGPARIIEHLIPLHLNTQLWKAVLESNASEQGARMTAMDNATENAKELIRQMRLDYNQARQAAITTELTEIVSGAQALSE